LQTNTKGTILYTIMSKKKIAFFIIIIGSFFIINNLVHSIYTLWQKKTLFVKAMTQLENEKKENQELKKKLNIAKNSQFVEEEARNNLFMVKPGEEVVLVPTIYLQSRPTVKPQIKDTRPNWKKWWTTFF
jgi:cell division protein FtsB